MPQGPTITATSFTVASCFATAVVSAGLVTMRISNMYPFFRRWASVSFLLLTAVLPGCSGGSTPPPVSVPLSESGLHELAKCDTLRGSNSPRIYRCDSDADKVFVTAVKDCSIPEKFTFQATTRQLLVGVMDLTVISQEPALVNSTKTLQSVVHGTMDVDPFIMSIFTFNDRRCVTDLAVWKSSSSSKPSQEEAAKFAEATLTLAQKVAPALLDNEEPPRARE